MLTGPIPATERALSGVFSIDDIDVFEVNEASAPGRSWAAETRGVAGADQRTAARRARAPARRDRRDLDTATHELERTGGRYGLQTMCEGGGQANATIIERV
jgi:acetyl-CoA C-acetyltransferase